MTNFDKLIKRRNFGELVVRPAWQPCNRAEDPFLTVGTCLLGLAPILIIAFFSVL